MYGRPIMICNKTFIVSYLTEFLAKRFDTNMSKTQLNFVTTTSRNFQDLLFTHNDEVNL